MGATIFRQAIHVDQFLCEMSTHQGNPFPGRFVFISEPLNDPQASDYIYAKKAVELLEKFGKHILYLDWEVANDCNKSHLLFGILKTISLKRRERKRCFQS